MIRAYLCRYYLNDLIWKYERIIGIVVSKLGELGEWYESKVIKEQKINSIQNGPGQLWITRQLLNWPYSTGNVFEELI